MTGDFIVRDGDGNSLVESGRRTALWLCAILAAGLLVRCVRLVLDHRVEKDSVLYVDMARDWDSGGVDRAFERNPRIPPLYVALMALGERIGVGAEATGVLVSMLAGALLPLGVFLLVRAFVRDDLALLAAFMAMAHPGLIRISAEVMRDGPFLSLAVYSLAFFALGAGSGRGRWWLWWTLGGVFAGLAVMVRSEGIELMLAFLGWGVLELVLLGWRAYRGSGDRGEGEGAERPAGRMAIRILAGMVLAGVMFSSVSFPAQIALSGTSSTWTVVDHRILSYVRSALRREIGK